MKMLDVYSAKDTLSNIVHKTALEYSDTFSKIADTKVFIKLENLQKTGSFKVRGAYNAVSSLVKNGVSNVVAASAGNHAQGVAFSANALNIKSTIVMPKSTPIAKVVATQNYGANVILHGDCYDDACEHALDLASKNSAMAFVHPFDNENVIAGQATVALEIIEQNKNVDTIVVPCGGGGLLAGVAFAIKNTHPKIKVIGVQAQKADAFATGFKNKKYTTLDSVFTIADGIAVKKPGLKTFDLALEYVDDIVTVTDDEIASSIIHLIERTKLIAEPAGASSLAAALYKKISGKNIVCVLSGGNIDVGFISKIIERGLVSRGRQLKFSVILVDKPGSLEKFAHICGQNNANIVSVRYDRQSPEVHLNETILHIACEVGGFEHGQIVLDNLRKNGYIVQN